MNEPSGTQIIKSDTKGRRRYTAEFREEVLDAFENSGMSAVQFAGRCGVKYQTFAVWARKRRAAREGGTDKNEDGVGSGPRFLVAEIGDAEPGGGLSVTLPGGAVARASRREDLALLVELIRALA